MIIYYIILKFNKFNYSRDENFHFDTPNSLSVSSSNEKVYQCRPDYRQQVKILTLFFDIILKIFLSYKIDSSY